MKRRRKREEEKKKEMYRKGKGERNVEKRVEERERGYIENGQREQERHIDEIYADREKRRVFWRSKTDTKYKNLKTIWWWPCKILILINLQFNLAREFKEQYRNATITKFC